MHQRQQQPPHPLDYAAPEEPWLKTFWRKRRQPLLLKRVEIVVVSLLIAWLVHHFAPVANG